MLIIPEKEYHYYNSVSSPSIYVDMDGTLCDFFRYFAQINYYDMRSKNISVSEISASGYRNKAAIRRYVHKNIAGKKIDYWSKIPMTRHGKLLWNSIKQFKPYIFTGLVQDNHTMEMGKIKWCRRRNHLGFLNADLDRILVNKNRTEYAMTCSTPNILIDDDADNCLAWENAGGIAYLFIDNGLVADRIACEVREDIIRSIDLEFLKTWNSKLERHTF